MTSRNSIQDLRAHLFKQLEQLNDTSKPADIPRARAVSEVAQTVINSLKVEVEYLAIVHGEVPVPFIEDQTAPTRADIEPQEKVLSPMERTAVVLASGPGPDHPWRKGEQKSR